MDAVRARLPPVQPATPYDDLIQELKTLLIMADPQGATYAAIGAHLGIEGPANWGPDKRDMLADAIARAIVRGRDRSFAMDELLNRIGTRTREHRSKLINLLVSRFRAAGLPRRSPDHSRSVWVVDGRMPTGHRQAPDTVGMIQPTPVRASAAAPLRPHHSLPKWRFASTKPSKRESKRRSTPTSGLVGYHPVMRCGATAVPSGMTSPPCFVPPMILRPIWFAAS